MSLDGGLRVGGLAVYCWLSTRSDFSMLTDMTSRRAFLRTSTLAAASVALCGTAGLAQAGQADARIDILPGEAIGTISPEIYSHFIEHLGGGHLRRGVGGRGVEDCE